MPGEICARGIIGNWIQGPELARKSYGAEQVVNMLRQIEVAVANGKTTTQACKEAEITEQTYYRWRKEYGGLQVDQAKRLKELEQENAKLKRLVEFAGLLLLLFEIQLPPLLRRRILRYADGIMAQGFSR